jgi:hypothetical protein
MLGVCGFVLGFYDNFVTVGVFGIEDFFGEMIQDRPARELAYA